MLSLLALKVLFISDGIFTADVVVINFCIVLLVNAVTISVVDTDLFGVTAGSVSLLGGELFLTVIFAKNKNI